MVSFVFVEQFVLRKQSSDDDLSRRTRLKTFIVQGAKSASFCDFKFCGSRFC